MLATVSRITGMSRVRRFAVRHYGLTQIAIVIGGVELYEMARHWIQPNWPAAYDNAHRVVSWEQFMNIAWEQSLQRAFLDVPELVKAMNVFYFVGHFVLTSVFFFWLYHTNRDGFRLFRNGFLAATGIALVIHWRFPTAPPRLVTGYVDTTRVEGQIPRARILKKPYRMSELANAIKFLLKRQEDHQDAATNVVALRSVEEEPQPRRSAAGPPAIARSRASG